MVTPPPEWARYHGDHGPALDAELAAFHAVGHALTCASGTLAVEVALRALKVGPGDEVVTAAYDYEANFLTVHAVGATPVLVDVHPTTGQLDPAHLEAAFTPKTRAVLASHLHGGLVPMREVVEAARRHGVGVVEDAAQAPGATVQGRPAGTWGDVGTLSFGGSKLLTAGRGGAVLTSDPAAYYRAKNWLRRGPQEWAALSELQAVVLRPQLADLPARTAQRAANAAALVAAVADVPGLTPFGPLPPDSAPAFYKLGFHFDAAAFGLTRDRFVAAVRAEGVALDIGFRAVHVGRSPSRFRAAGPLPHATALGESCVVLHHPVLLGTAADIGRVAAVVRTVRANSG